MLCTLKTLCTLHTVHRKNLNISCEFTKNLIIHKSKIIELSNILDLENLSNKEKVKAILKNTGHIIFENSLKPNEDVTYESDKDTDLTQNSFSYRKDSVI